MFQSPAIPRVVPFAIFIALMALHPLLVRAGADVRWLVVARGAAAALALAFYWRQYGELRAPRARLPWHEWALAVAAGFAIFLAWIVLDRPGISFGTTRGFSPLSDEGAMRWPLAMARLCALALIVPVMEELFWRSFLMRWIAAREFLSVDPKTIGPGAFVISSALFASEHAMWLAGLLAGLAYAWLYRRTGNLWIPIVSHAITNGTLGLWILATGNWRFW
jgi:CAAX prenyl protease-like protein